jgi:hypothetical protein
MTTTTPSGQPDRRPGHGQPRRPGMRLGNVATAAATAGRYVFPIHRLSKIPAVEDWEAAATRDLEQIRRWWAARPYNIGIATGKVVGRGSLFLLRGRIGQSAAAPGLRHR